MFSHCVAPPAEVEEGEVLRMQADAVNYGCCNAQYEARVGGDTLMAHNYNVIWNFRASPKIQKKRCINFNHLGV